MSKNIATAEAAEQHEISSLRKYCWARSNDFSAIKIERSWLIPAESFQELLKSLRKNYKSWQ